MSLGMHCRYWLYYHTSLSTVAIDYDAAAAAASAVLPPQPKVVTDVEDEELRLQMEELAQANLEVAGDDDVSDEDDMGAVAVEDDIGTAVVED